MIDQGAAKSILEELTALRGSGRQIEPFTRRLAGFDLGDAYEIVASMKDLRVAAGERPVGRKIGFTNRSIWQSRRVSAPIWNYMFDRTVTDVGIAEAALDVSAMPEPGIEPEVVLHLRTRPETDMTAHELADCVDWIAPGFEVVFSVFPDWDFEAPDAAAAFGVHGALFVGERVEAARLGPSLVGRLSELRVLLECDRGERREGWGSNVLGGPIEALGFLVAEVAHYCCEPLCAGEIITTGTLTEAMPLGRGQRWSAGFEGIDFPPIRLQVV